MLGVSLFGLAPAVRSTARVSGKTLGAMKATQFRPHAVGVKTPRMLEVEARLGRTLEEDFQEYYVDKNWGQKRLSRRWQVTRAAIFGRGETTDLKCWVQVLQLPVRRAAPHAQAASPNASSACEICGVSGVPLEGAHWIAASQGGESTSSNILKLCPNCHTQLDLSQDSTVTSAARAVLLTRVARRFAESSESLSRDRQLQFVEICRSILDRRR